MDIQDSTPVIQAENLTKYYDQLIFENVSFSVARCQVMAISGPSGIGKTTLLRCMAGLDRPGFGTISINGQIVDSEEIFIKPHMRSIGMAFQDLILWPHMTVYENIDFASHSQVKHKRERKEWNEYLLNLFSIEHKRNEFPAILSGGEQQRVALARSVANKPKILLLDEPFSHLDNDLVVRIVKSLDELINELQMATIMVMHDAMNLFSFDTFHYALINNTIKRNQSESNLPALE